MADKRSEIDDLLYGLVGDGFGHIVHEPGADGKLKSKYVLGDNCEIDPDKCEVLGTVEFSSGGMDLSEEGIDKLREFLAQTPDGIDDLDDEFDHRP